MRYLTLLVLIGSLLSTTPAHARSRRGSAHWSVILCAFQDSPAPPHDPNYYRNMFFVPGTGGMADYWAGISNGGINLSGSDVAGWYQETFTIAQAQARSRGQKYQDCIDTAHNATTNAYSVPAGNLIAVVTSPGIDLFGYIGVGSFLPDTVDMGGMTHEVGHGLGYQHSFSDDPNFRDASWAQIGEYDDEWDAMSWANAYGNATASYGFAAPGMNGPHVDQMGWLGRDQILTFEPDRTVSATVNVAPLNSTSPCGGCYRLVRVPFDPADLLHYYAVEFRTRTAYDAGIPANVVMIHEVKKGDRSPTDKYISYLLRDHTGSRNPIQTLNANGVTINVGTSPAPAQYAVVSMMSQMTQRCLQGYVWREASPNDHVCVTPGERSQARQQNTDGPSHRSPNGGPFGPDTCLQGYVWRDAFPNDHVCVSGADRTQAEVEKGRFLSYGPNTCSQGYVWREADQMDYVCVSGTVRDQTRQQNAEAASHRDPHGGPFGPDTCLQGYVWRDAFPGDHVCVSGSVRSQAQDDNSHAEERVVAPL